LLKAYVTLKQKATVSSSSQQASTNKESVTCYTKYLMHTIFKLTRAQLHESSV